MIAVVGCAEAERRAPAPAEPDPEPLPEYHPCESLGDRRFEARYCIHAEGVRIEDHPFMLCHDVHVNPRPELYVRLEEAIARSVARDRGWAEGTFDVSGNEGTGAVVDLDVCVVQEPWSAEDRRHRAGRRSFGEIDASRPLRTDLVAARSFSLRPPSGARAELAEVGEWPRRTAAPPVEWLGYDGCSELPERFTSPTICVHVEHVIVRDEPIPLCDRLTLIPSLQLTRAVQARVRDHLAVGEHSEERWIDIDEGGEYAVTLDVCVLDSDIARAPDSAPTVAGGFIDPRRERRVEIERARFRYRWDPEEPLRDGRLGEAEAR